MNCLFTLRHLLFTSLVLGSSLASAEPRPCNILFRSINHIQARIFGKPLPKVSADRTAETINILEKSVLSEISEKKAVAHWIEKIVKAQESGVPLSILEHSTLIYFSLHGKLDAPEKMVAEKTLEVSWEHLTGSKLGKSGALRRLPWRVLRHATREDRIFHAAAFQGSSTKTSWRELAIGRDYVPETKDIAAAAVLGTLALTNSTAFDAATGLFIGYTIASVGETIMHKYLGHASKSLRNWAAKKGWLAQFFIVESHFSHTEVHHGMFKPKYTVAFRDAQAREKMESKIDAFDQREKKAWGSKGIRESGYGTSLTNKGFAFISLSLVPPAVVASAFLGFDPVVTSAMFAPLLLPGLMSKYVHPYMHMDWDSANAKAGPLMSYLLGTRYVGLMSRLHYGHHRGRGGNYNLVPGGDLLLLELRKPNMKQILEMRRGNMLWGGNKDMQSLSAEVP